MEDFDFRITSIRRIIKRTAAEGWCVENLSYNHDFVLVIALNGKAEYTMNGEKFIVKKNDLLLFPPKFVRSGKACPGSSWGFISIIFRMDMSDAAHDYFCKSILVFSDISNSFVKRFLDASKAWIGKNPLYNIKCSILTTEILYELVLSQMPYHKVLHINKLEETRVFIQEHFRNDISVDELAASVNMSVSYFRRLFHEAYGYSPMQYIMNLRIENARDLLLSGEVNVTEAAQLSGFDDIYYFSTAFKRKTGFAPTKLLREQ